MTLQNGKNIIIILSAIAKAIALNICMYKSQPDDIGTILIENTFSGKTRGGLNYPKPDYLTRA